MPREASGTYTPLPSRSSISFRDEAALSRDARRHGAPALVGDLCARRRNDTPFIATRESIERSSPSRGTNGGGGERYGKRGKEEGRDPAGWSEFYPRRWRRVPQHIPSVAPPPGVCRYVSRLPSASMVLSTLQKSLSTCCPSVSPALYIRECRAWMFSVATSFYAFNIIKRGITGKSERGLLIKSCNNQQYI